MNTYTRNGAPSVTAATGTNYHLIYVKDSWAKRIVGVMLFYGYLGFLVWLSIGSTFWTFIFGTLAIISILTRMLLRWKDYNHSFSTKRDLVAFVEGLPDN